MRSPALLCIGFASLAIASSALAAEDLIAAAQRNDGTVALAAIEDGVDVNGKAPDGTTALHWAVYNLSLIHI